MASKPNSSQMFKKTAKMLRKIADLVRKWKVWKQI